MKVTIIINPAAGRARGTPSARIEMARRAILDAGHSGTVRLSEAAGHARAIAADRSSRGDDLVVAWGGDGTINEVVSGIAFSETALGIVPSGSGNGLARELGLPLHPAEALRAALGGTVRRIDVGEMAGRLFANIAGIGFDAVVAGRFNTLPTGRRGAWPYVTLTLGALRSYRPDRYRVTLDDAVFEGTFFTVILANSPQFGNRMRVAPEARPDDGLLAALLVDHRSVPGHLWRARWLLIDPVRAPGIVRRSCRHATIEGTADLRCQLDGESFTAGARVEARVHPGALALRM